MRERTFEHYIEIPLSEYRKLVEEITIATIFRDMGLSNDAKHSEDLEEMKNAHAKLSEEYEHVVEELERYKRMCDKEDK